MNEPAHKILIDRYLKWELVEERLGHYENISKFYPIDNLKNCSSIAPFYCHYLAWRLGTWKDEQWFEFFNVLLGNAAKLPGWNKTRVPQGCEFENFWSFLWELQIAQLFLNKKANVEWTNSGPDLKIDSSAGQFFVECTVYRKSFGLEEFIDELLTHVHSQIRTRHIPLTIFSLPKNKSLEPFLDELCKPFLDAAFLEKMVKESQEISPVLLPTPNGTENLYIFIENHEATKSNLHQPWAATGSPEIFLDVTVKEALDNKRSSNDLKLHRPNLLAVNLMLGVDFQLANAVSRTIPTPNLGTEYNAVFLAVCGIDEIPSLSNRLSFFRNNHPIRDLINQ